MGVFPKHYFKVVQRWFNQSGTGCTGKSLEDSKRYGMPEENKNYEMRF